MPSVKPPRQLYPQQGNLQGRRLALLECQAPLLICSPMIEKMVQTAFDRPAERLLRLSSGPPLLPAAAQCSGSGGARL